MLVNTPLSTLVKSPIRLTLVTLSIAYAVTLTSLSWLPPSRRTASTTVPSFPVRVLNTSPVIWLLISRPFSFWKAFKAAIVFDPKLPSTPLGSKPLSVRACCILVTSSSFPVEIPLNLPT